MWIRTKDGWYIFELKKTTYISWVSSKDKSMANVFQPELIGEFLKLLTTVTGKELEAVQPFV